MIRVVIAGAGGHGREILAWLQSSPLFCERNEVAEVVFINDETPSIQPGARIVSGIREYAPMDADRIVCALGEPVHRQTVTGLLQARGGKFLTFVHDEAFLGRDIRLGVGAVICPRATITTNVVIGSHVHVNVGAHLAHDTEVGDFATISPGAILLGGSSVGKGVYVGAGATLLPGQRVGDGSIVGAMALVTRGVEPEQVVAGVPARKLRRIKMDPVDSTSSSPGI